MRKSSIGFVMAALLAAAAAIHPASAQTPAATPATPEQICANATDQYSAEEVIAGCTAAIDSKRHQGAGLASLLTLRAYAYDEEEEYEKSLADMTEAIRIEPTASRYDARCSTRAVSDLDLQLALADCNQAIKLLPGHAEYLDSRAFVYLKLGRYDEAIADYNESLKTAQGYANALFGRGIAKIRKGDAVGGQADIAAAKAAEPDVAERFEEYNMTVTAGAPVGLTSAPADCARAETHWKSVEELKTPAGYEDHLARFGSCDFASLARARLEAMKK